MTDEELIEGLSFPAYRRVSTAIFVPAPSGSAVEMVPIDPLDLQAAQERDAAVSNAEPATALKLEIFGKTKAYARYFTCQV